MHSSDRTLLAKLGFADPDKKESRHDLACQYLALPETQAALISTVATKFPKAWGWKAGHVVFEHHLTKGSGQYQTTIGFLDLLMPLSCITIPSRGIQWCDIVGMCNEIHDLWKAVGRPWTFSKIRIWANPENLSWDWKSSKDESDLSVEDKALFRNFVSENQDLIRSFVIAHWQKATKHLAIEVKIHPVPMGDVLRQLKLYQTYAEEISLWLVATAFDISVGDLEMLKSANIAHVRLGAKFDVFASRAENPSLKETAVAVEV